MKLETTSLKRKTLIALGIAATLGMTACNRPDGQMSDSAAANAPKESASLGAAIDDTGITAKVKEKAGNDSTDTPTTTTTASPGTGVGTTPGTGAGGLGSGEPTSGPGTTPGRGGLG